MLLASIDNPFEHEAELTLVFFAIVAVVLWLPLSPVVNAVASRFWLRYGAAIKSLAKLEVRLLPSSVVAAFEALANRVSYAVGFALSEIRLFLDPAAERRRRLGRYLAALPPHSGLTAYEELELEINSLPAGVGRLLLRKQLKQLPKPSASEIARARAMRGLPRARPGLVNRLLHGQVPKHYGFVD